MNKKKIYDYVKNQLIFHANEQGDSVVDLICNFKDLSQMVGCLRCLCDDYKFCISTSCECGMCYILRVHYKIAYPLF